MANLLKDLGTFPIPGNFVLTSKSGIAQFCAKWSLRMIAQSTIFPRKNEAQQKQKFVLSFIKIAQKFCEWKPYLKLNQNDLPMN